MKKILFASLFLLALLSFEKSYALSEYGSKCEENSDCVKCATKDSKCARCMNACFNRFGPPEMLESTGLRTKFESCRLKRARWCNAQCWDPDDKKDPEYITTKPDCREGRYPKYYEGGFKKTW